MLLYFDWPWTYFVQSPWPLIPLMLKIFDFCKKKLLDRSEFSITEYIAVIVSAYMIYQNERIV